jgi:2-keto-4-pentenoate hydratase
MPGPDPLDSIARKLAQGRLRRDPVALAETERPRDEVQAYEIQTLLHQHLQRGGHGRRIGWKIGCTTPVMRRYLGIETPCAGGLFSAGCHESGVVLPAADFRRVGIECEIAVELGEDLRDPGEISAARAGQAVRSLRPAIEIVDDRYADWRTAGTTTLIADDFFSAGCVLGQAVEPGAVPDLAGLEGRILVDGRIAGRGCGADVMGHPFAALAWLARSLVARGEALRAGDIVLTGSLVQTEWLVAGTRARIEIDRLGHVDLQLT